jgi:putative transposase
VRGAPLSKDAVSRLVGRLREDFEAWAQRDLGTLKIRYLFLDRWYPRVRIGKKRVRVPVLVTLGVCANGQRDELCRRHGISSATLYKWKAKYGGLEVSEARRLKALEDENRRLKKLLAESMLDNAALKDLLGKNG